MQILVLGMHRSGTSAVTRLINMSGAYFGPDVIGTGHSAENPKGFWERRDIRLVNDALLSSVGSDWDRTLPYTLSAVPEEVRTKLADDARCIISELDAHRPWVAKEPRFCLTLPFWLSFLETPVVVQVFRNPLEVARSLHSRNSIPVPIGLSLWEQYVLSASQVSKEIPQVAVFHDMLIRDPVRTLATLLDDLAQLEVRGLSMPADQEIEAFMDSSLHRARAEQKELDQYLLPAQQAVWEAVCARRHREVASRALSRPSREALEGYGELSATLANHKRDFKERISDAERRAAEANALRVSLAEATRRLSVVADVIQHARNAARYAQKLDQSLSQVLVSNRYRAGSLLGDFYQKRIPAVIKPVLWRACRFLYRLVLRTTPQSGAPPINEDTHKVRLQLYDVCRGIERLAVDDRVTGANNVRREADILSVKDVRTGGTLAAAAIPSVESVDIVVCVHNALEDVRSCLESVIRKTATPHTLYLVNDGSDEATTGYLQKFAKGHPRCVLIENAEPLGYTRAANQGLRASKADYVVLLNSDTTVSDYWLEGLIRCGESDPNIGIVGPVSNAASWQSVPERFGANGDWEINALENGLDVDAMSSIVRNRCAGRWPKVPLLNGFCLAIKRRLIERVGFFDEESFPYGYGEENDYCLRTVDAGFALAVADDVYVYHAKSRSYDHDRRRKLAAAGRDALQKKYPDGRITRATAVLREEPALKDCRDRITTFLERSHGENPLAPGNPLRVLFLLPVPPGSGGGHSIVQEVAGMRQLGADARVAIRAADQGDYARFYPHLVSEGKQFLPYREFSDLLDQAIRFDVVVATINNSVAQLVKIAEANPEIIPAYYIQDYEPLFYPEGSPEWSLAYQSYALIPGLVCFSKTRWLCDILGTRHGIRVEKVVPSLDRSIYHARDRSTADAPLRITAMIRPSTPRRAAPLTMRVLRRISQELGDRVRIEIYGCRKSDPAFRELERGFSFTNHEILTREQIADLYRSSHVFADYSTYQAFGRTGLEAMACGVAVILPRMGGTGEYAVDRSNALLVDTESEEACYRALRELCDDSGLRVLLAQQGLATAARFSIERAALSELIVLRSQMLSRSVAVVRNETR